MSLNNVKSVKAPIQIGSYLAKSGSWNRKYKVLAITPITMEWGGEYVAVEIQYVGSYYASGRTELPKRPVRSFEVVAPVFDGQPMLSFFNHVQEA
jgi:hypothetical protein